MCCCCCLSRVVLSVVQTSVGCVSDVSVVVAHLLASHKCSSSSFTSQS